MVVRMPVVNYDLKDTGTNGVILTADIASIHSQLSKPQNYTFIIDMSVSMQSAVPYMRDILVNWLQTVPNGCGVAFVVFSDAADVVFYTDCLEETNRSVGISCLKSLHVMGNTNIESGIDTALDTQHKLNSSFDNRVVLLTDGHANYGERDPIRLASLMARFCCKIDVVMLTENSSAQLTEAIKSVDDKHSGHFAQNADQLQTVFTQVFQSISKHPLHFQVATQTKVVYEHYDGNTIDLLYDELDGDHDVTVRIFVECGGGKEQILETTLSETRGYKETRFLKSMIEGISALKKLGVCKSDFIANKEKADVSSAANTLEAVNTILMALKINGDTNTATYRSLSGQVKELSPIVKAFDRKDPGECPVKFEMKKTEFDQKISFRSLPACEFDSSKRCVFRSLGASSAAPSDVKNSYVKEFASVEDEEAYNKWARDKAEFSGTKPPCLHALLSLKPICM